MDQSNANPEFDVRRVREGMRLTQRQFAGWFGFPVATLRHWERGSRHPAGAALVLLYVIRENPRVVLQAVRKVRARSPGIPPRSNPPEPIARRRASANGSDADSGHTRGRLWRQVGDVASSVAAPRHGQSARNRLPLRNAPSQLPCTP